MKGTRPLDNDEIRTDCQRQGDQQSRTSEPRRQESDQRTGELAPPALRLYRIKTTVISVATQRRHRTPYHSIGRQPTPYSRRLSLRRA